MISALQDMLDTIKACQVQQCGMRGVLHYARHTERVIRCNAGTRLSVCNNSPKSCGCCVTAPSHLSAFSRTRLTLASHAVVGLSTNAEASKDLPFEVQCQKLARHHAC